MKKPKGFTLIELVFVLAVIGILTAIAIPNYLNYFVKLQQADARVNLRAIYVGMLAYTPPIALDGYGGATLDNIGFSANDTTHYAYSLVSVTTNTFLARAHGISGRVVGETWEIDESECLIKSGDFDCYRS